jgi:hypothetical protein
MRYRVTWFAGTRVVSETTVGDPLLAKRMAQEQFPIKRTRLGVDAVEVRDEAGSLVLRKTAEF